MSAGLVDLGNTLLHAVSICSTSVLSGGSPASGEIIGVIGDMRDANFATNLCVHFGFSQSGSFRVQVQTAADTNSGSFQDPTSGLQRMPTNFLSGGIILCNSGTSFGSGGIQWGCFLRPGDHRYVRARVLSGDQMNSPFSANFEGAAKRTGSGPGYSFSPASGTSGSAGIGGF
jgi:hypothetical protein